ncbi:TonB-dependent receptor domain-containing protein [Acinetobacter courvalinii]|uniref:TonB-dependent receptor n=1 Tax=Acinetobacter courvalinii TaxID=280147 RepID=A0AA42L7W8_9GAMM|nr:TonB-dependent receptor [Acinetobacter courvalinii]MDH0564578.1 TonB-dependent receptor [Acinetobacter courvalinii]
MSNKIARQSLLTISVLGGMMALAQAAEIQVNKEAVQLEKIVVTASSQAVDVKDAPASISVITRDDIEKQPVASIGDLLSKVPGVTGGISPNGDGSKIKLRGLPDNYTLILIDGKRIGSSRDTNYRPDLGRQDLNWITPEMIERIEVVRGPMSSLYGSDAMGGVINIITRKIPDKWGGSLTRNYTVPTASGDLGHTDQMGVMVTGPLTENLGLRLTAGRTEREADQNIKAGQGTSGYIDENYNALLNYRINDKHQVAVEAGISTQKNKAGFGEVVGRGGVIREGEVAWGPDDLEHHTYSISHDGDWGFGKSKLSAYYNDYDSSNESGIAKSNETIIEGNLNIPFNTLFEHTLTIGGQWKKNELTNTQTIGTLPEGSWDGQKYSDPTVDNKTWAIFLEDNISLLDNLSLTVGNRLDHDDKYGSHHSPRAYLVYHPFNDFTIKGGVAKGFRAPSLKETTPGAATFSRGNGCSSLIPLGYVSGGCYMAGNPNLKPEESTNYEISLNYNAFNSDLGLTYFHTDFKDKIDYAPLAEINGRWYTRNENIGKARTRGLELVANFPITDTVNWNNNMTYFFEAKNLDTGKELITTPKITVNSALNWKPTDALALEFNARHLGKQYFGDKVTTSSLQKPHTIFGISANYEYNDNLTFRTGINNLFDKNLSNGSDSYLIERQRAFVGITVKY